MQPGCRTWLQNSHMSDFRWSTFRTKKARRIWRDIHELYALPIPGVVIVQIQIERRWLRWRIDAVIQPPKEPTVSIPGEVSTSPA